MKTGILLVIVSFLNEILHQVQNVRTESIIQDCVLSKTLSVLVSLHTYL